MVAWLGGRPPMERDRRSNTKGSSLWGVNCLSREWIQLTYTLEAQRSCEKQFEQSVRKAPSFRKTIFVSLMTLVHVNNCHKVTTFPLKST